MTLYYVDNSGADGDGSLGNPWNNIAGHVDDLSPDDTMYIRGDSQPGRVYTESPIAPTVSGTSGNAITIMPYPTEYVIIKTTPEAWNITLDFTDVDWWTVGGGLKFDRDYVGGTQINIDNASHLRIRNSELYQNGGDGAIIFSADNAGDDVLIDNCTIYDTFKNNTSDSAGILILAGTNITISNCTIYDCRGDCIVSDDVEGQEPLTNLIIEDCHLYTTLGKCSENAIDLKYSSNIARVRRCEMHGFRYCDGTCGGSGGGIGAAVLTHNDSAGLTIEDCEIYDCASGIKAISNTGTVRIQRNVFYDFVTDGAAWLNAGIYCDENAGNTVEIYNNTFVELPEHLFRFSAGADVDLKNNLAYETHEIEVIGGATLVYDYNGWFNCDDTLSGANDTTGSGDPGFVDAANDDYTLLVTSICIDVGIDVGLPYNGVAPDLGAYEYIPSTPPPPPPPEVTAARAVGISSYKLRFYSPAGVLVVETADFWRLSYAKRVNYPGLLTFNMDGDHTVVPLLENRSQVEVWRRNQYRGIEWHADFRGLYLSQGRQYTDRNIFTAYCPGQIWFLSTRIVAWFAATANRAAFSGMPAETIMKTLVDYNACANATTGNGRRRNGVVTGLSIQADGAAGNSLNWKCAWKSLLAELQDLALVAGGDFDLVKTAAQAWQFRWYTGQRGTDRSASVIFALDRGNMSNPHYRYSRIGEKTVAVVGGAGEEANRDIVIRTGADYSADNNVEIFVDARNLTTTAGQNAAGDKRLDELRARDAFNFDVEQTASCLYGSDYELGDLVTARAFGVEGTYKIVSSIITLDEDGSERVDIETEVQ